MYDEEQIKQRLKDAGWAKHVYAGGRSYLLTRWAEIVKSVEDGYEPDCMLEEYWNDLDTREAIDFVGLGIEVVELDRRFKSAITRPDLKIRNSSNDNFFWNYGYPRKASGYFLEKIIEFISDKHGTDFDHKK